MEWFELYLTGLFFSLIQAVALFSNDIRCGFDGNWKLMLLFVAMCLGSFVTIILMVYIVVYVIAFYLIVRRNRKQRGL